MKVSFVIAILCSLLTGNIPVIYKCIHYEYKDENDPSKNTVETEMKFLSVDFNSTLNPHVSLTLNNAAEIPEDVVLKWNIKTNLGTVKDPARNAIKTTYMVRREVMGIEEDELIYLYVTDDMNIHSTDIIVHDPNKKISWCFYGLIKE